MIEFIHNGINKLSHTKPCNGLALCESLAKTLWGFVLQINQTFTMKKFIYLGLLALFLVPSLTFASFDVSLKYGAKGDAVSELQDFLTDQNVYTGKVDGKFGLGTLKAVKAFQTANNLSPDGYFGKGSRAIAVTLLTAELKPSDDAEQAETGSVSPAVATIPGCTSNTGFSMTTGHPCDGSTPLPKPVTDTATQQAITSLSQQVQNLTTQLQTQTPIVQAPVVTPPIVVADPLKFVSFPLEGGVGPCTKCIWVGTNNPSKVTIVVDGVSYSTDGLFKNHYFLEFSDGAMDPADGGHPVGTYAVTNLNLDDSVTHTWDISKMVAVDANGSSVTGYSDATTQTIPKK